MTDYLTPSSSATSSDDQLPLAESDPDGATVWRNQALAATAAAEAAAAAAATSVDSPPLYPHLMLNPVFPGRTLLQISIDSEDDLLDSLSPASQPVEDTPPIPPIPLIQRQAEALHQETTLPGMFTAIIDTAACSSCAGENTAISLLQCAQREGYHAQERSVDTPL